MDLDLADAPQLPQTKADVDIDGRGEGRDRKAHRL
jgi:hypothetical protein